MTLFTPDLFRNFAFGFIAGGLLVGAANAEQWTGVIETPAKAAAPLEAPISDNAFVIAPLEGIQ
ncbi:hypothetical protein INR77_02015 [Erythrobacter sp. SCSIO 43205]|uniref:hypothetical protein n=1 Tax=Erythrobacter sp. SCSIO 43205 TaxID=2779361 RepID=UPI001CA99D89|nr:hypothetical protein [Erythrobacter sp. SCSIO 43205]UAB78535.1 hypothetical protein INR77_02015 [Erythrobacter sp. SCSIO 43205]